jgi:hypothetical protein
MLRDMPLLWRFRKRPWVQDSSTVSASVSTSLVLISCLDTVKNHGVNEDVVEKTFAQAETFFATSSDVKKSVSAWTDHRFVANGLLQVDISNSDNFRGWMGVLTENNDP